MSISRGKICGEKKELDSVSTFFIIGILEKYKASQE